MHENEFKIDITLVQKLLQKQFPDLANLSLTPISSTGTDNTLFRLGDNYVIRMPRIDWGNGTSIDKEYKLLPQIAKHLKLPISEALFKGKPDETYPFDWLIAKWNEGKNPDFEKTSEYALLAEDLAEFLNELHEIKLDNGPLSRRGVSLTTVNDKTTNAIALLEDEIDVKNINKLWNKLIDTPAWNKDPVWIHGDLLPGNILLQNNRLSAVIDFSDLGIGDPACDLIIAWSLFNHSSREIFRAKLKDIDDNTWERGRAWALSISLIMLSYYRDKSRTLSELARMIKAISSS